MSPGVLLLLCVGTVAVAVAFDVAAHRRRTRVLRQLAAGWRMTYHAADQLRLTPKVLPSFPIPGAANVRVMDVIYGSDHDRYRYVFSVEFTVGLVGPKRRLVRVASLSEPRDRRGPGAVHLNLAPAEGTLVDQYRYLAPASAGAVASASAGAGAGAGATAAPAPLAGPVTESRSSP
jgi:hypothetical protein